MSKKTENPMENQIETIVAGPARTYASLMLDHVEQLTNLQLETAKAYAETGLQQARAALEVKNPSDFQTYIENQQKVTEESAQKASKAAEEGIQKATQAAAKSQ